jgi:hypothetical protein
MILRKFVVPILALFLTGSAMFVPRAFSAAPVVPTTV